MKGLLTKRPQFGALMALVLVVGVVGAGLLTQKVGKAADGVDCNSIVSGSTNVGTIASNYPTGAPSFFQYDDPNNVLCQGPTGVLTEAVVNNQFRNLKNGDVYRGYSYDPSKEGSGSTEATFGSNCAQRGAGNPDAYYAPDGTLCYDPSADPGPPAVFIPKDLTDSTYCSDYYDPGVCGNQSTLCPNPQTGDLLNSQSIPGTDSFAPCSGGQSAVGSSEPSSATASPTPPGSSDNNFVEVQPGISVLCDGGDNESSDCPKNPDGTYATPGSTYYLPYYEAPAGQCQFQDNPQYCDGGGTVDTSTPQPTIINDPNIGDGSSAPISAGPDCSNDPTLEFCQNNGIGQNSGEPGYEQGYAATCQYTDHPEYCDGSGGGSSEPGYEQSYENGYENGYSAGPDCNNDPTLEFCQNNGIGQNSGEPGYEQSYENGYEGSYEGGYGSTCEYTDHPEYCQ